MQKMKMKARLLTITLTLAVCGCGHRTPGTPEMTERISMRTEPVWYVERMTDEQRKALKPAAETEENRPELFSEEEKRDICWETLRAAESCTNLYEAINQTFDTPDDSVKDEIIRRIQERGFACADEDGNMKQGESVERFCTSYEKGEPAEVTVFEVQRDGTMDSRTFCYRAGRVQTCYMEVGWKDKEPYIRETIVEEIREMRWTEKGYFIYTYENTLMHGNLREYYRVRPLPDRCRELTERYLSGLSYVDYNMLVTDWDGSNAEEILMPAMFEDIYRKYTGERLRVENGRIPADIFEKIMTACFPVTAEQVRRGCGYSERDKSYPYEIVYPMQFVPFGEVVDYEELPGGTIILYVDAVWPDYNSDCAFTNKIVVENHADGTFCYLSNQVEKKELDVPTAGLL